MSELLTLFIAAGMAVMSVRTVWAKARPMLTPVFNYLRRKFLSEVTARVEVVEKRVEVIEIRLEERKEVNINTGRID